MGTILAVYYLFCDAFIFLSRLVFPYAALVTLLYVSYDSLWFLVVVFFAPGILLVHTQDSLGCLVKLYRMFTGGR